MRRHQPAALALLVCSLMLVIAVGCGGEQKSPYQDPRDPDTGRWLAEISAAPLPAGVDAALFQQLKDELQRLILSRGSAKAPGGSANAASDLQLSGSDGSGWSLSWSYLNTGDYNLDSQVTVADLTPIGIHFGIEAGQPGWLAAALADGDHNGRISVADLTPIGLNFRSAVGAFRIYGGNSREGPWTEVGAAALPDLRLTTQLSYSLPARDYAYYCVAPVDLQDAVGAMSSPSMATPEAVTATVSSSTQWQSQSIGAAGGSLSGPGVGAGPITALIPAGALGESVQVSLGLVQGSVSIDGVPEEGYFIYLSADPPRELALPATLTVPFTPDPESLLLPLGLSTGGGLLPLETINADYSAGSLSFNLYTLYPAALLPAALDAGPMETLQGIAFLWRSHRQAVREDLKYAFATGFDPLLDGFSFDEDGLNNILRVGQESFAAWYFRNYSSSMGKLGQRFKDPAVQLKIAARAETSVMSRLGPEWSSQVRSTGDAQRDFDAVKAAMRVCGPVLVSYREGNAFNKPFLAYAYRGAVLLLYDADDPGGWRAGTPLDADHGVLLIGGGSLSTFESFENILLDATADPPFGGSEIATVTISSHQAGDYVQGTEVTISGTVSSSYQLVTGLYFLNDHEAREQMRYVTVPEGGDFSLPLKLYAGVNSWVVLAEAQLIDGYSGLPFRGIVNNNLEDGAFYLHQGEEQLPEGWLRFRIEWSSLFGAPGCAQDDPYKPYLLFFEEGSNASYASFASPGSLEAEPFALWEDKTSYSGGVALSGSCTMTLSRVAAKSVYLIQMNTPVHAYNAHRITRVTVSGVASGSFDMTDGSAGPDNVYTAVSYDSQTKELRLVDASVYVPPL